MKLLLATCAAALVLGVACQPPADEVPPFPETEEAGPPVQKEETAPRLAAEPSQEIADESAQRVAEEGEEAEPTVTSSTAITAPTPPGGYAILSRPVEGGMLAFIEYASPLTVEEVGAFYDGQIESVERVEVETDDANVFAYALSASTTLNPTSSLEDIERLLSRRSEPVVVVGPWTMDDGEPLIRELEAAGQSAQAEALRATRSKVTVVYAVR